MSPERCMDAARGYLYLGLPDEALAEIEPVPFSHRFTREFMELRTSIHMARKQWLEALVISRNVCHLFPDSEHGFLDASRCLHKLGRTQEAKDVLLQAPSSLRTKAVHHFQMSRLEAKMGNVDSARKSLKRAIALDPKYRKLALKSEELHAISAEIAAES